MRLSDTAPGRANQATDPDNGVLSGEAVAGLNPDDAYLAVLSACQTGLGEAARSEGAFGLHRAVQISGARDIFARLWKVDNEATAALMNLLYYHLWEKAELPLEGPHHARPELYRNPWGVPSLARSGGAADLDETVRAVTKAPANPKAPTTRAM